MKILLLGKNGQVGHALQRVLPSLGELVSVGRDTINLVDSASVADAVAPFAPDLIVNAAAYTAVDKAETEQDIAQSVNATSVAALAAYAKQHGALLVHYSTDYVFDGDKPAPYVESDTTNPKNVYGKTKLEGELAILNSGCDALIFRTSWVFSAHGANFIKSILGLAQERDSLNVVADQHGAPTSARLIAETTRQAISAWQKGALASGLYHLTASGDTTWHGLACHAVQRALDNGAPLQLKPTQIKAIPTEAYPTPAARPRNSRLDTNQLAAALQAEFPAWHTDVDRVVDELTKRNSND